MKYKIKFLQSALDDLEEIVLYIAADDKYAAIEFHDKIINKSKKLVEFPRLGRVVSEKKMKEKGYRMLLVENYMIFYRIINTEIIIYRVLHGSRNYPRLFNSL